MQEPISYGFLAVIPSLITVVLAISTRRVLLSLLLGILSGVAIMGKGNPLVMFSGTIERVVNVFTSPGNVRAVLFTFVVGIVLRLIQDSGGVGSFVNFVTNKLQNSNKNNDKKIQMGAFWMGALLFIESNVSILATATIFRSVFDRFKIAREKLAYIVDSGAAPFSIIIPLNAWGAFVISLLASNGFEEDSFFILLQSQAYNFYPILALMVLFFGILFRKDFRLMKKVGEANRHKVENTAMDLPVGKLRYMAIPLTVMVVTMPLGLIATGWARIENASGFWSHVGLAVTKGEGSSAVLYSFVLALLTGLWLVRKHMSKEQLEKTAHNGIKDMLVPAALISLAFTLGGVCRDMNTGLYLSQVVGEHLPYWLIPMLTFWVSSAVSFSTGTSWGTFAIMVPVALPLAAITPASVPLMLATVLGGGIFGDHCSPISDTTIMASLASGCEHMDHVRTQLPYALLSGGIASLMFLLVSF